MLKKILCIGGPLDGQYMAIESLYSYQHKVVDGHRYWTRRFNTSDHAFLFWVSESLTPEEAVEKLIEWYAEG